MHKINTTTKKFLEAVTIDLGQLPTVDTRIDFILTDGTNPVIAENKTFAMTIGSVLGSLYKTDEDTVSFRYLKFNDDNIADTLVITMTMDGVEILNDVISLKYQRECIDKGALEEAINAKADKATTLAGYGISDAYTKTEIDAKVSSVYHYKGTVSAYADLPASGQKVGDVWNVETADSAHGIKAGDNVAWNGTTWDVLAGEIDLTAYPTKSELATVATTGSYNDLTNRPDLTTKLDAPAVAGTVGQVLTKTADGQEWADAPGGGGGEDTTDYLCFTSVTYGGVTVRLDRNGNPPTISLEYSVDKKNWTEYTWSGNTGATITLANYLDSVWWRGDNTTLATDNSNFHQFKISGSIEASGNIMSLLDRQLMRTHVQPYCFSNLFYSCSYLYKAPKLPTEKLGKYCYYRMFSGCSSLTKAPELPATTLAEGCYSEMFYGCKALTKAPELPATTLAEDCYDSMFSDCSSLTKAPELPATKLQAGCYSKMFSDCTSLTKAPELNAQVLAVYCYHMMFYNCIGLKKVKVGFSDWKDNVNATKSWLIGVPSSGVFECPSIFYIFTTDESHVPAGWTIVRTDSPKSITSPTKASSEATYQVSPNTPSVPVVTVASALKLSAAAIYTVGIAYAEIVLDVASGATVTAGGNMTLVDEITAGKRNICVCRWSGGVCKLYVTIVEDLPQA